MGFPVWTLVGMGFSVLAALLLLVLAYLAQSPRLLKRLGLAGYRLDLRARMFTGYALAAMLLSLGFFIAGVPLGAAAPPPEPEVVEVVATPTIAIVDNGGLMSQDIGDGPTAMPLPTEGVEETSAETATPNPNTAAALPDLSDTAEPDAATETSLPEGEAEADAEAEATDLPTPEQTPTAGVESATSVASAEATPTPVPEAGPTEAPTPTPMPTMPPTPIIGETATINTGSSTIWLRRTPGGQNLVLVTGGDTVILLSGHANMGGTLWREVSTVDGTLAWVEEIYLTPNTSS